MDETFICFSGLSDLANSEWSEELCGRLQIDQKKLPEIVKPTQIIGELTTAAAGDTGLRKGIPICAGCGDQAAGFIGAGITGPGQMVDVSGTACVLGANIESYTCDRLHKTVACMKSATGDGYYLVSVVLGGRTHNWFIDEFYSDEKKRLEKGGGNIYSYLDDQAQMLGPGSDGLIAIDYLQGRFFPPDSNVRGLFIGHSWAHKKIHFYRAILESIAYDHYITRDIITELAGDLDTEVVTAIGSGARSTFWMQIKADVLQIPYQNLFRSDLATLGSAVLAGHAAGIVDNIQNTLKDIVKPSTLIRPVPGKDREYLKYIDIYRELFSALRGIYAKISS
jgi:xylulokinase